jgi:succinate dehydrogenase / fumarate reductase iron-sulfur subunit
MREGEDMTITAGDKNAASEVQASGSNGTRLMNITVRVWRQPNAHAEGRMVSYEVPDVSEHMSFLEMLDVLNERLTLEGDDPIAFDHDCREGICGQCGVVINGVAHGPQQTTTCQLHMRSFRDGDVIDVEPWRADPFPVIKDLVVNRGALDRIIAAGGYISANTGSAPDAHATPIPKVDADHAFDAATCIQCGACVAACPNGSAMLFTAAKVTHLGLLPQGQPERHARVLGMVAQHDEEGFGGCSNIGECTAVCPKGIPFETISRLNRDLYGAITHPNS